MIILEGMDNSGKSTLAKEFKLQLFHPGPAPRTSSEERVCLRDQAFKAQSREPMVMDRVTAVSSQVYGEGRLLDPVLCTYLDGMLKEPGCILIYCRPPIEKILSGHKAKAYDTPEAMRKLMENGRTYIHRYDIVMSRFPHRVYDWTKPDSNLVSFAYKTQIDFLEWTKWKNGL